MEEFNTVTKIKKEINRLNRRKLDWDRGKLSMTGVELKNEVNAINILQRKVKEICKHKRTVLRKGYWVDQGYGTDINYTGYDIHCNVCDHTLILGTDNNGRDITEEATLKSTAEAYLKYKPHERERINELLGQ